MIALWPGASMPLNNGHQGYSDDLSYQSGNLKRSHSDRSTSNTPEDTLRLEYREWPLETEVTENAPFSELPSLPSESTDPLEDEVDASKLKGVKYPGMGLFDAADDAQKRKRNQRKDDSIVRQMEETSSGIEPTECVWTEIGEFQRSRNIYATPSVEGSPVRRSFTKRLAS